MGVGIGSLGFIPDVLEQRCPLAVGFTSAELRARTAQAMGLQEPTAIDVYRHGTNSSGRDVGVVQGQDPGLDPGLTNGETQWRRKASTGGYWGLSRESKESLGGVASQKPREGSRRKGQVTWLLP